MLTPAPGVLGGCSLLTAVQLICLTHLLTCIIIVSLASSVTSVDYAGVRISGFMQCINAAWFLAGIPAIIIGGVGAVFRVEAQLKLYLAYLVGTLFVVIGWLAVFVRYGNACNTIQPTSGQYKKQALMVCQASNGMAIFWMLVLVGIVAGAIYLVWSMLEYVKKRLYTELIRYQEPWEAVVSLADDAAENEAKERRFIAMKQQQQLYGGTARAPDGYFNDPLKVQQLSNQVPGYAPYGSPYGSGGMTKKPRNQACTLQ